MGTFNDYDIRFKRIHEPAQGRDSASPPCFDR